MDPVSACRRPLPGCFRAVLLGGLIGALGAPAPGRTDGAEARREVVLLTTGARPARDAALLRALRAQLTDLPVSVLVRRIDVLPGTADASGREEGQAEAVVARCWLRERADGGVDVHLADPRARRLLVRTVSAAEVGHTETIALLLGLAVRALLLGGGIDVQPPRPREGPRPPPVRVTVEPPRRPPRQGRRVTLALSYLWTAVSRSHPGVSSGVLELAGRLPRGWALLGMVALGEPLQVDRTALRLRLARYPVALGARWAVTRRRLTLGASLALGLEVLRAALEPRQLGVAPADDWADVTARLIPEVHLQVRLGWRLSVRLDLGAEVVLNPRRYTAAVQGGGIDVLLYPWPVQPRARLGLVLELD